jgi:cytochrome c biogenesis protein CcmG/thiol:disulfide interchange protein DsbE
MTLSGPPVGPDVAAGPPPLESAAPPSAASAPPGASAPPSAASPPTSAPPKSASPVPPTSDSSTPSDSFGNRRPRRRRSRIPLISAITVGCITALLVAVLATSKDASKTTIAASPLQDKPAPEIRGPTLGGGNGALSAFKGKWVLINFFASWCVPCQQEQADLVRFQNNHASGDAVIFGVRFDDPDTGPITDMMNRSGARWPIVDDANAKIDYSVTGPPESFFVSPGGIVLAHIIGPITDTRLEEVLNQEKLVVTTPSRAPASTPSLVGPGTSTP